MPEEILDIVDHTDTVIGQMTRTEANKYIVDSGMFRGINVFIENDQGQLWVPRRTAHKKVWPSCLDLAVGGCVSSGENYEQALVREAQEEANLDLTKIPYTFLGYFTPPAHGVGCFMKVYKVHMNEAPVYNPDDYCEYFWLTPQQLRERINAGEPVKSDLSRLLKIVYGC